MAQEPFPQQLFQVQGLVREQQTESEQPVRQVVLLPTLAQGLQLLGPGQLLRQQVPELLLRVPVSQRREQQLELSLELLVWQGRPLEQMQRTFPEGLLRRYP